MSRTPNDIIEPIGVSNTCWMYPERKGLAVVIEGWSGGERIALQHVIPWDKIETAVTARPQSKE